MKNYERILTDKKGKDSGVREDYRGSLYIDHEVFFSDKKVKSMIKKLSALGIVDKKKDQPKARAV